MHSSYLFYYCGGDYLASFYLWFYLMTFLIFCSMVLKLLHFCSIYSLDGSFFLDKKLMHLSSNYLYYRYLVSLNKNLLGASTVFLYFYEWRCYLVKELFMDGAVCFYL